MCRKILYLHERACSRTCKVLWFCLLLSRQTVSQDSRGQGQLHVGVVACVAQFWGVAGCHRKPSLGSAGGCESDAGSAGFQRGMTLPMDLYVSNISCCLLVLLHLHDLGLPQDCFSPSLGTLLITFTATHFKIWGKKKNKKNRWGKLM